MLIGEEDPFWFQMFRNHSGTSGTKPEHLENKSPGTIPEPFGTKPEHLEPNRNIWNQTGIFGTKREHLEPNRNIWDYIARFAMPGNRLSCFSQLQCAQTSENAIFSCLQITCNRVHAIVSNVRLPIIYYTLASFSHLLLCPRPRHP